jgi:endonuclease YncB( thermonuclease family)
MKQPPLGWTTPVKLVRVLDGDTVEVVVERKLIIRISDLWCEEIRGGTAKEKAVGFAAKSHAIKLVTDAGQLVLHVPIEDNDFKDRLSMGRVVGKLFADEQDIAISMIEDGHGTATKKG